MTASFRTLAAGCAVALAGLAASAHAQFSGDVIRIGFITDLSGVFADVDGPAGAEAMRWAIADAGGQVAGRRVELLVADHLNKADIAAAKAREWFDTQGLDMLVGGTNSAAALAMAQLAAQRRKPFIVVGAGTSALTNEQCSPYTIHWAYDTVALAKGTGGAVVQAGGKNWYFLTADFAFGHALQNDTSQVVQASGGKVLGSVRHPLNASDFSSFLVQAQASNAQILGLANAGGDVINAVKAANEFGVTRSMKLAGLLMTIADVHALGLKATQGMYITDSWYWNRDARTRAWGRRFFEAFRRMPTGAHVGDYSAVRHYLQAVKAVGTDDGERVMAQLRKSRIDDVFATGGYVREDGRMVHDMYLVQVKAPEQSEEPWDYYRIVQTIPGEAAFTTRQESRCALWK